MEGSEYNFATLAVHGSQEPEKNTGAVCPPISLATTFAQIQPGLKYGTELANSFNKGFEYSRTGNPTRGSFEIALAGCEKGKFCIAFASGMAASSAIIHLLKSGDHVISIDDVYGGTQRYFRRIANPTYGMEFSFIDMSEPELIKNYIKENTKMIWIETPTNPTLKIVDIHKISLIAKKHNLILVVDNTFMSPYLQNPLCLGADIIVHSVTKYINGHSDVVMGAIITNNEEYNEKLRFIQNGYGAVPSPFDCYMALRGLKTLHIRMDRACENAFKIAKFLENHINVDKVIYPGLESHPQHEIAKTQQKGYGAMITFYIRGGIEEANNFLRKLKVFVCAESLGAVESLAESPAIMTHASVPVEQRKILGISDNLIRLSIGIEDIDDLLDDLTNSLE